MLIEKAILMDGAAIDRTLMRMAHEVIERDSEEGEYILFGIRRGGVPIARQLAENIQKITDARVSLHELDISGYRDDRETSTTPQVRDCVTCVTGKTVVLVDDVLHTGRTIRAAMDAVMAMGRPRAIRLAVLIDRGHRELPIRPDFVGKNIPTSHRERIEVRTTDEKKEVAILEPEV